MAVSTAGGRTNCIALDEQETSMHAFQWYVKNYHRPQDTLILIHIHQMPQIPAMGILAGSVVMSDNYQAMIDASIRNSKHVIQKFKKVCEEHNIRHEEVISDAYHSPGHMIVQLAKEKQADVIVTGQRGLGALGRVFIGSTSDYVLHHAHIPVVVIPPEQLEHPAATS